MPYGQTINVNIFPCNFNYPGSLQTKIPFFPHCGVPLQFLTKWVIIITTKYTEADLFQPCGGVNDPPLFVIWGGSVGRLHQTAVLEVVVLQDFGPEENWLLASQSPSSLSKITPARAAPRSLHSHPFNWRITAQGVCIIQSTVHFRGTAPNGRGVKWLPESPLEEWILASLIITHNSLKYGGYVVVSWLLTKKTKITDDVSTGPQLPMMVFYTDLNVQIWLIKHWLGQ